MGLSVLVLKLIVLGTLLIMTSLFGLTPIVIVRFIQNVSDRASIINTSAERSRVSTYKRVLGILNCFASGVFLATCLLDLLPGVRENLIQVLYDKKVYTGFPVAEFVMVFGMFLILIIEQIVLTVKERQHQNGDDMESSMRQPLLSQVGSTEEDRDRMTESYQSDYSIGGICDEPHLNEDFPAAVNNAQGDQQPEVMYRNRQLLKRENSETHHANTSHGHNHRHSPADHSIHVHSPLRTMLLLFALSLHSIFEGLTIGLQESTEQVLNVFVALSLHKSILSFSLGMNLMQSKITIKSVVKSVFVFSLSSPVGIAIGIAITDLWTTVSSGLLHGLLQGIASGTFLYIIFFEILPKEFNCESDRLLKVLFLILGFGTVTGVLFLDNDVNTPFCVTKNNDP